MDMMEIRRRVLLGSRKKEEGLPNAYQRVEYIENSGTQYIETNYIPTTTQNMKIECEYMFTASQKGDSMLFGVDDGARIYAEKYAGRSWYGGNGLYGFRTVLGSYGGGSDSTHKVTMDGSTITVDDGSTESTTSFSGIFTIPLYIFARNATNKYINCGCRIYSLVFTANGTVEANFVPCYRISDGEIGMYDIVGQQFYTNAGTGTFLKGADV